MLLRRLKNIQDLKLTQTENFDFRFGVFSLTTSKQNAWLENAAFINDSLVEPLLLLNYFKNCLANVESM